MSERKRKVEHYTKDKIFSWFVLLEQNNMEKSKTARELKISRTTLNRNIAKYWDEYLVSKSEIHEEVVKAAEQRLVLNEELDSFRKEISVPFRQILSEIEDRIKDPEQVKKLPFRVLIEAFKEMAPYVAEKQGLLGIPDPNSPDGRNTSVVNNIIQNMQIVNNGKDRN